VVFRPPTHDPALSDPALNGRVGSEARQGTIVAADLEGARREARTVTRDGGTADVVYVDSAGGRHVLATYTPDDPTGGSQPAPT